MPLYEVRVRIVLKAKGANEAAEVAEGRLLGATELTLLPPRGYSDDYVSFRTIFKVIANDRETAKARAVNDLNKWLLEGSNPPANGQLVYWEWN